jgi:hypothetical protein
MIVNPSVLALITRSGFKISDRVDSKAQAAEKAQSAFGGLDGALKLLLIKFREEKAYENSKTN